MQSVDLTETHACGTSKDLVNETQKIKCSKILKIKYNKTIQK